MSNTKQPNLGDLAIDHAETRKIRSQLNKTKRIKITINIDERSLTVLRKISRRSAAPYLRLLDQALKERGIEKGETKTRLDRIEKELKKMDIQASVWRTWPTLFLCKDSEIAPRRR
jgi:Zn-dependent M16 (insulinase) family peptidase